MAEVIVDLLDLYMSCMLDSSSWSVVSSCVGADGCWSKDQRNCCVSGKLPAEKFPVVLQMS